ncbi:MAG: siroheme synthase CysG [Steroidobacteraceae bacterium]|jgi:uroporphyrin-III C-methyltransferase/precorrin-2 dehydrogenase/sirohydrochlorin ferrochelatase|nr:siroheme synthase CysG [Steroidobacteraceae bacterium]
MDYFPLFLDLRSRPVLLVGGGAVASRKLALLLEAGAHVTVVAPALGEALSSPPLAGRFAWREARFEPAMVGGQRLVVAATGDRAVNAEVAAACERAGLPVNVVDDPELSSAIVPAIVDRSPLVIAISSAGTAPMLARLVREKLETAIDESFGALARVLARARRRIVAALPDAAARRRFYGDALAGPVASLVRAGRESEADAALERALVASSPASDATAPARGRVLLVGAGPGDPGLLTLRALRAIQEADVVVHDGLVSDGVLALVRRDARRIPVAKQGGGAQVPQAEIDARLVALAREGLTVVRLKGGDPFVFGRGAEELRVLRAAGIPYEVVPGITAAVGAAAYAGIPLTDRGNAAGARLLTARRADDAAGDGLAAHGAGDDTLAIYMGRARLRDSARTLLRAGRPAATPVALVEHATRPQQRVLTSTLGELAAGPPDPGLAGPTIMIVGEAAALAAELHWFAGAPQPLAVAAGRAPLERAS